MGYAEAKGVGEFCEEPLQKRTLPGARGAAEDEGAWSRSGHFLAR